MFFYHVYDDSENNYLYIFRFNPESCTTHTRFKDVLEISQVRTGIVVNAFGRKPTIKKYWNVQARTLPDAKKILFEKLFTEDWTA
jgi:hypothetical protein